MLSAGCFVLLLLARFAAPLFSSSRLLLICSTGAACPLAVRACRSLALAIGGAVPRVLLDLLSTLSYLWASVVVRSFADWTLALRCLVRVPSRRRPTRAVF